MKLTKTSCFKMKLSATAIQYIPMVAMVIKAVKEKQVKHMYFLIVLWS